jgi:hypothetical protein
MCGLLCPLLFDCLGKNIDILLNISILILQSLDFGLELIQLFILIAGQLMLKRLFVRLLGLNICLLMQEFYLIGIDQCL